ncbi:MAG: peptidyl-prolyl cis-trans isomerase [Rhodobacteraceae bacterium]|nr:peptidyl-prolyl cis-trans isomerase [Paracoccaceae bacterium]
MILLKRVLREPLIQFLVLGALVFGLYGLVSDAPEPVQNNEIVITQDTIEQARARFAATWQRQATEQELDTLIDALIVQEILVREAEALSLDQNDTVIRQRLVQKMTFLLDAAAAAQPPAQEELQRFFDENADTYRAPAQLAFDQVYLGTSPDNAAISGTLSALRTGAAPQDLGESTLLPAQVPLSQYRTVDATFGNGFFNQIEGLEDDNWSGPIQSGYGLHLVRITDRVVPALPDLEQISDRVAEDLNRLRAQDLQQQQIDRLRDRYVVVFPKGENE